MAPLLLRRGRLLELRPLLADHAVAHSLLGAASARVGCLTRPVTGAVALETFDTLVEVSNVGANWQQLGVFDAPGVDYGMVGPQHQIVVLNGPLWRFRVRRWQGV